MRQLALAAILVFPQIVLGAEDDRLPAEPVSVMVERPSAWRHGPTFADTAGQLWQIDPVGLLKWDGKSRSWQKTPVTVLPRPEWKARPAPPWFHWEHLPRVIPGHRGSLLVVVVSDIYQVTTEAKAKPPDLGDLEQQAAAKGRSPYWLEGWLYRDGRWSTKGPLADLLKSNREFIVEHFTEQTADAAFFDLQVVGKHLWWCDGTTVHVLDKAGNEATWQLPKPEKERRFQVPRSTNLVLLADGTLWHLDGTSVTTLSLVQGRIETKPQSLAKLPLRYSTYNYHIHITCDGRVWMSCQPTIYPDTAQSFLLRDSQWVKVEDVGEFCLEDPDGNAWFLPGHDFWSKKKSYRILKGNEHLRLSIPGAPLLGMVSVLGKNRLLACCGDRVVILGRSKEDPGWKVQSVLGLKGMKEHTLEHRPFWLDGAGNLVGGTGWVVRLPEGAFP